MKTKVGKTRARVNGKALFVFHILLMFAALSCLYPFLLILGSSFQGEAEIAKIGYRAIPHKAVLDAYKALFASPASLINAYKITAITTVITTVAGLWVISTYGYVLSRRDYAYRKILSFYAFFTMLFNGGMVPSYILIAKWLGLKDSIWALILPLVCNVWNMLMMKSFFMALPSSLIESAKIDGAGELRIFTQIIIPISKPAFATIGLFYILNAWNDWNLSLLYIDDDRLIKLQYLLMRLMSNMEFLNSYDAIKYGVVRESVSIPTNSARMAMCILAAGPIVVIFPFFQKYFVKGITVGSVKG